MAASSMHQHDIALPPQSLMRAYKISYCGNTSHQLAPCAGNLPHVQATQAVEGMIALPVSSLF